MLKKETPTIRSENQEIPDNPFDRYFQEHPEAVTSKQLNNFLFNLSGGFYRDANEPNMDKTHKEKTIDSLKKEGRTDKQIAGILQTDFSEKRLNQTPREFFKTVDEATGECASNLLEKIDRLNKERDALLSRNKREQAMKLHEEIDTLALSVYKKLRGWGYDHEELIR